MTIGNWDVLKPVTKRYVCLNCVRKGTVIGESLSNKTLKCDYFETPFSCTHVAI